MSGFNAGDITQAMEELSKEVTENMEIDDGKKAGSSTAAATTTTATAKSSAPDINNMTAEQLKAYIVQKQREEYLAKLAKKQAKLGDKSHKFWNTQPVDQTKSIMKEVDSNEKESADSSKAPSEEEAPIVSRPLDPNTDIAKVKQEPYAMPAGYEWCELDMQNEDDVSALYKLLSANYVEDDDATFRFDYSADFLQWALTVPGYRKDWHVGVRVQKTGKLMASITAIPANIQVRDHTLESVEINFLCVHKKLRDKRLAPVLIKEVTRRVNLTGRWQAAYTAGVVIPSPIARTQYFHRNLQVRKLCDIGFSAVPKGKRLEDHVKELNIPTAPTQGMRPMEAKDVLQVTTLLNTYLAGQAKLHQVFEEAEVAHLMLPRPGVLESYVKEDSDGKITDFGSYYHLPSSVMKHPTHKKLNAVYAYYSVATTMTMTELVSDLLILAKNNGTDVFNSLNVMQNGEFFEELQFGPGDGFLQYYIYNWTTKSIKASEVGLVLT
jgi:glycylpeptide N-tetradecanoyltransferase